ncbi:MAG: hypothetical protein HQ570_03090 [Candidatus Omnitrophica bacterium]|nr:hypothetical protein [Candidatus Omnitrophota bacterium]
MDEGGLRNNYIFTLVKLALFLIILCFLVALTREFWQEVNTTEAFNVKVLVVSILCAFSFYVFIADLNSFYKGIQKFFFHSTFFAYLIPSVLVLMGIGYFFLPKILNLVFSKDAFVFVGGFTLTGHLIFVARGNQGNNFPTVVNYLFIFSILYILNLLLFSVYLKIGFSINIGRIIFDGMKGGSGLIQSISTQAFR